MVETVLVNKPGIFRYKRGRAGFFYPVEENFQEYGSEIQIDFREGAVKKEEFRFRYQ